MITAIKKRRNIIIFYLIITLIGLTSGYKFYSYQEEKTKQTIIEKIDIKENLSYKTNNILNDFKDILKILIYSTLLITLFINIFNIFYKSFQIGFLFNILNSLNTKLSIIYLSNIQGCTSNILDNSLKQRNKNNKINNILSTKQKERT